MVNYSNLYDDYWTLPERQAESSFEDPNPIARQILSICGLGRILDIGCGKGILVTELLRQGVDAFGVDVSKLAVAYAERLSPSRFSQASILNLPHSDQSFDTLVSTACLEHLAPDDVLPALKEMHRVSRRFVFLQVTTAPDRDRFWHRTVQSRSWWEDKCFLAGFRKHPCYYIINSYSNLDEDGYTITIPLEKIPSQIAERYPITSLLEDRGLHMDMSRETGPRSDAHMARYTMAAEWIRAGDTVLDCACGLGYGSASLAALSRGKRYLAIDVDERAIIYGQDNFSKNYGIEFRTGDAENLSSVADASVDTLVSFETMEHVLHFERFLAEARRLLKPDGRIIAGIPNRWVDETGRDPNPYHHHVFDYQRLRNALEAAGFVLEARYAQSAPGGFKLLDSPRILERRPTEQGEGEADTEWWLVVASRNPMEQKSVPYSHPVYTGTNTPCVVDFGKYYNDPWIYRPLVQIGERISDPGILANFAETTSCNAPPNSADVGAALTVRGYGILSDKDILAENIDNFLERIENYITQITDNPHVLRWAISLAFLGGLLSLKKGDRISAKRYFRTAAEADFCAFSPLLATKTVTAWYWLGALHLADDDHDSARKYFTSGIAAARVALHAPDREAIGDPTKPLPFGFHELAEIAEMAGQCANALDYLDEYGRAPGKLYRMVDARRFGLANWAMSVEKKLGKMRPLLDGLAALDHEKTPLTRTINSILSKLLGIKLIRVRTLKRLLDQIG